MFKNGLENLNNYEKANEYFEIACLNYRQCKCFKPIEEFMMDNRYLHQIAFCYHNARRFMKAKINNSKKLVKDDYLNNLMFSKVLNELVTFA